MTGPSTRDLLLATASVLFRQKGYDGVGVSEILAAADLPKGSLYHHFPEGKCQLAEAATFWAAGGVEKVADRVYADATDFTDATVAFTRVIADVVKQRGKVLACPVASILQVATREPRLRAAAQTVLARWSGTISEHAARMGHPDPRGAAEAVIVQLQGAWFLALAEQSSKPFERLARRIADKGI